MDEFTLKMSVPTEHMQNVFGQYDAYIRKIENELSVMIVNRDEGIKITGTEGSVRQAESVLKNLIALSKRGNMIQEQNVDYTLEMSYEHRENALLEIDQETICHTINGKPVKPKTLGQKIYVDAIKDKKITYELTHNET